MGLLWAILEKCQKQRDLEEDKQDALLMNNCRVEGRGSKAERRDVEET
jgi:hypothetical protein